MSIFNSLIQFLIKDFIIRLPSMKNAGAGIGRSEKIQKIKPELQEFASQYMKMLNEGGGKIDVPKITGLIFQFFNSKPTPQEKVQLNVLLRMCFQDYLNSKYCKQVERSIRSSDSDVFIDVISNFWENYQRFTFCIDLIANKGEIYYRTFNATRNFLHITGNKNQVAPIPVIAVYELQEFMQRLNIINRYSDIFCAAIAKQREGKTVQSQKIRDCIEFFEASFFNYDAVIAKSVGNKPVIRKKENNDSTIAQSKHSQADKFFDKYMMQDLLEKCEKFYKKFVQYEAMNLSATEEITVMLQFIQNEESRGHNYIHEQKNFQKYIDCVNRNLIEFKMEERITKPSGFSKYLSEYDMTKQSCKEELENFWKVYSRIYNESKDQICKIYNQYFLNEGQQILELMEKGVEFVNATIALNKKNRQIVNVLGNMLDFDRIRVESVEKILSSEMIKGNKWQGKYFMGAKHLAVVLNMKIKAKYSKDEKYGEEEADLMGLFKIFKYKTIAIKQHTKLLNNRLLEQLDISKDAQYINAVQLQQHVIEQIRKQSSENDVKNPQQCLKDIGKSEQTTNALKSKGFNKKFPFFNQIIIKNNTFWNENTFFDIQPPQLLQKCIIDISNEIQKSANIQFELFNGVSNLRMTAGPNKFNFLIKNIYVVILLMIDERTNKKMFYSEIKDRVKPSGRLIDKAYLELSRYLVELTHFGVLKSNKTLKPGSPDIQKCEPSDWFQINRQFKPMKKVPIFRTNMIAMLPEHLKKPFAKKMKQLDDEQKQYEKDRKVYVQGHCVKLLKHAHHNGGGTVTLEEMLKYFSEGRQRELNVTSAKYLKEIIEALINKKYCERVQGKKNTLKYIA